ncbi:MAG: hypothetical protein M9888_01185 [Chitinophagales bacterium]|nr:hypothetical protein [Chitinophagales bacterium]
MSKIIFSIFVGIWAIGQVSAQNIALGQWQTHLPYSNATSVALSQNNLYGSSEYAVFSYHLGDGSIKKYTKSEGLSDVGISTIAFDTLTRSLIIAYSNSNLDILQGGKVKNLPFIMKANILGGKGIKKIFAYQGIAWLATDFGIVELRLDKQEIGDTYYFSDSSTNFRVNEVWADDNYIFAATAKGVYRGKRDASINLVNFQNWQKYDETNGLSSDSFTSISGRNGKIFAASKSVIYQLEDDLWTPYYVMSSSSNIANIFKGEKRLIAVQTNRMSIIPDNGVPEDISGKYGIAMPLQVLENSDGRVFYADLYRSVMEYINPNNQSPILPNGPSRATSKGIDFLNNVTYVGSSPINASFHPTFNATGFYTCQDFFWTTYTSNNLPEIQGAYDIAVVKAVPEENLVLFGAHNTGLIEFSPQTKNVNFIKSFPNATSNMRLTAATKDIYGNVWFASAYSTQPLVCRKAGGEYLFFSSSLINNKLLNGIAIDDFQQVWISTIESGLVVFSYNGTLDDKTDDKFISYTSSPGNGGLPSNAINCVSVDLNGQIWIGSNQGVFTVPCPGAVFEKNCDAIQICVPRNDGTNFCDLLLETENVSSIAIDAANRKWFGTSNGIFLQSEDGYKNIHYFSQENSPLLSNKIRSLGIDPNSGDLFISTESGIISYRAEATANSSTKGKPYAYPNPVRPEYHGDIAIKNLPENGDVKVTDIAGRLVAEGKSLGSQFIWDGKDIQGNRVKTGIYYILSTSKDKKEKAITKIAFIH